MSEPTVPPPDLAPRIPDDATPQQCIAMWMDLMDAAEQMQEHDRALFRMAERLGRLGGPDADLEKRNVT